MIAAAQKANGPASVGALPDRGSHKALPENAMNTNSDSTAFELPATEHEYASTAFEPFPRTIVEAIPSNDQFGKRHLSSVRLAAIAATKTKAELVAGFRDDPETFMDMHDGIVATEVTLRALADLCERASARILIAGSVVAEGGTSAGSDEVRS